MKLSAPAKVNLHLRICGKRADGFHDLETLMVPVSLADELTVETGPGSGVDLECDHPEVPTGTDNLVVRAARLFAGRTGRKFATRVRLEKRIPMGAGLGGGSSDAAAVLVALDRLLGTDLGPEALESLAAELGSDVPFFVRAQPAWCRGRGEIMEPMVPPESLPMVLIKPGFGVETPWAYKHWADSRDLPGLDPSVQDLGWVKIFNSLERPVFEKFLLLPTLKQWLRAQPGVRAAAMSGSGSTMFAVLQEDSAGETLIAGVRRDFGEELWVVPCRTINPVSA